MLTCAPYYSVFWCPKNWRSWSYMYLGVKCTFFVQIKLVWASMFHKDSCLVNKASQWASTGIFPLPYPLYNYTLCILRIFVAIQWTLLDLTSGFYPKKLSLNFKELAYIQMKKYVGYRADTKTQAETFDLQLWRRPFVKIPDSCHLHMFSVSCNNI